MSIPRPDSPDGRHSDAVVGTILVVTSILVIALILHHPTGRGHDFQEFTRQLHTIHDLNQAVHGTGILMMCVLACCFNEVCNKLVKTFIAQLACGMYLLGSAGMILAALVSGFVVPNFAFHFSVEHDGQAQTLEAIVHALRSFNHSGYQLGVVGLSLAVFLLSLAILRQTQSRILGWGGLIVGALGIIGLQTKWFAPSIQGVLLFFTLQAMWNTSLGMLLMRRSLGTTIGEESDNRGRNT
ncbi:MAG: hypothetical protein KDB22_23505 [Planctomycetales bacterium]|nr:hypothetical protein [Planctomycetales bacterium]